VAKLPLYCITRSQLIVLSYAGTLVLREQKKLAFPFENVYAEAAFPFSPLTALFGSICQ
jgi:hypothetical protein